MQRVNKIKKKNFVTQVREGYPVHRHKVALAVHIL